MESQLTLAERYTYGNRSQIKSFYGNAEGKTDGERLRNELLIESPNRQRAMINLAERQIRTQERAAQEIVASNIAGAEMVSSQISQQTQEMRLQVQEQTSQLQSTFESVGSSISSSISSAADQLSDRVDSIGSKLSNSIFRAANQISRSIDNLGSRLSVELSEIYWQNVQQNQTLERILTVLQENRNNEARQLVSQGLRLYVNEQYEKAEERFLRALDYDMTDYQVLMNLGYIEIHKQEVSTAFSYFQDALSLPASLDNSSKARTLWTISRLHYTQSNYQEAFLYAKKSLEFESQDTTQKSKDILIKHIFLLGTYAALGGKRQESLEAIRRAVTADSAFFTLAAVEPDLECIRKDVLELLANMSVEIFQKATQEVREVQQIIDQLEHYQGNIEKSNFFSELMTAFDQVKQVLQKPSYSDCIECLADLSKIKKLATDSLSSIRNATKKIEDVKQLICELKFHNESEQFPDFLPTVEELFNDAQELLIKPS